MQQLRMKKLKNYYSLILFFLLVSTQVKAQSVDVIIKENGNERQESIDLPVSMTYPLDSLLNDPYRIAAVKVTEICRQKI